MREFWVASGHHLTRRGRSWRADGDARTDHGLSGAAGIDAAGRCLRGRAPSACEPAGRSAAAGRRKADIAALADADARENWTFMMNFRDRLVAAPSLEAVYCTLARKGAGDLPPIFLSQLCHLILRNALEGCDDPYMLRAAELFYRSQQAAVARRHAAARRRRSRRGAAARASMTCIPRRSRRCCAAKAFGEMDVMDDENAWTYWSRSDAHAMVMNIGGNAEGARRAVPGDRALDRPSARRRRQCRDGCLDRGPRLALVHRPRQRGHPDRQRVVERRARWTRMRRSASSP